MPVTMTLTEVPQPTPELLLRVPEPPPLPSQPAAATEDAGRADATKIRVPSTKLQKWANTIKDASNVAALPAMMRKGLAAVASHMETLVSNKKSGVSKAANRPLSEYNVFVQEKIQTVAKENPGLSNKEVMTKIAEMWQAHKAAQNGKA